MKKNLVAAMLLSVCEMVFSQVGLNTETPSATLDIAAKTTDGSKPEGILAPRLTGDQIKAGDTQYGAAQKGLLIYATAAVNNASTKTANIGSEGYYYFDGNAWQKMNNTAPTSIPDINIYQNDGTLTANRTVALDDKTMSFSSAATTGTNHFRVDGTTLNVDAVNNRVGIGTSAPARPLHVVGDGASSPVRVDNLITQPSTGAYYGLAVNSIGDIFRSPQAAAPFYYQRYFLNNVYQDWVANFDTKIPTNKYTVVIVGNSFNTLLAVGAGAAGYNYSAPSNVQAYQQGGTWRIAADYNQATTPDGVSGSWTIYTLIIDNSQVNSKPDLTFSLAGSQNGAATASPVP